MWVPNPFEKVTFGIWGRPTELDRTFDVILAYTKFYVNPPLSSPRTLKKGAGNRASRTPPAAGSRQHKAPLRGARCAHAHLALVSPLTKVLAQYTYEFLLANSVVDTTHQAHSTAPLDPNGNH